MANEIDPLDDAGQGPAADAPHTRDGLYPEIDGDLAHRSDGDTEPLPNTNVPLAPGVNSAVSEPKQGTEQPDEPGSGLEDEGRPTGGNF